MKIDILSYNKESELIGDVEIKSGKAKITEKNIKFFISLLSKVYSDSFGSIVREITSNCVDAHIRVGKPDEPVIIRKYIDETGQNFIEFNDNGPGISEYQLNEVYMSYGESDKRESDCEHGAFGLGSKSPLSYSSYFYLITRVDGIEYTYLMNESIEGVTYDCLNEEPTDRDNGTTVRIPIHKETEYSDLRKFENAIIDQLKYFTTVFVEGFDVKNDYKIDHYKSFQIRQDCFTDDPDDYLHVTCGMATYPINFKVLGIEPIRFNAALKFNIGELDVVLNREQLEYTSKTISALKDKIKEFEKEFHDLFLKHYFVENNLKMFFKKKISLTGDSKSVLINIFDKTHKIQTVYIPFVKIRPLYYSIGDVLFTTSDKGTNCIKNIIPRVISLNLRTNSGNLTKSGVKDIEQTSLAFITNCHINGEIKSAYLTKDNALKRFQRNFINDENYIRFYIVNDNEDLINTLFEENFTPVNNILSDVTYLRLEFRNQLLKLVTENKDNVNELDIPKNYGIEKRQYTKANNDDILYYIFDNSRRYRRYEHKHSLLKDNGKTYIYSKPSESELVSRYMCSVSVRSKLNIMFIKCSEKYFKHLKNYSNCVHIGETDKIKSLFLNPVKEYLLTSHCNSVISIKDIKRVVSVFEQKNNLFVDFNKYVLNLLNNICPQNIDHSCDVSQFYKTLFNEKELTEITEDGFKKIDKISKIFEEFYNDFIVEYSFIDDNSYWLFNDTPNSMRLLNGLEQNLELKKEKIELMFNKLKSAQL